MTTSLPDAAGDRPVDPLLAEFLSRHRPQLVEHARWLMRGRPQVTDPDDVVQAASLSFCLYLQRRKEAMVERGLLTLARQCVETALSDMRKWQLAQKRRAEAQAASLPSSSGAPPVQGPGPATAVADAEQQVARQQVVRQAMAELNPLDRRIMELRLEGEDEFTFKRIGELVAMREDAVRMRYRRAIDWMKSAIGERLTGDSELDQAAASADASK